MLPAKCKWLHFSWATLYSMLTGAHGNLKNVVVNIWKLIVDLKEIYFVKVYYILQNFKQFVEVPVAQW